MGRGKIERLAELAAELVKLKSDVIVTAGPTVTRAAGQASSTIPIVMAFDTDPVGSAFAASLARPGGDITGLSTLAPEISSKQLELLINMKTAKALRLTLSQSLLIRADQVIE